MTVVIVYVGCVCGVAPPYPPTIQSERALTFKIKVELFAEEQEFQGLRELGE